MTSATFVILSGVLTYGVPLALAIREIVTLRPSPRSGDGLPPTAPRIPPVPRPLPECLPKPTVVRDRLPVRVLEDA